MNAPIGERAAAAAPAALPARTVWLLLACFLGAVLLNLHHTALWCLPLVLGAVAWRARAVRSRLRLPARSLRIGVVAVLTVGVLLSFRTLKGLEAGASLLVAMAALKLTETQRARDWLIVLGAALFLLLAACLDAQALWRLPLYAAELWLLCAALYAVGAVGAGAPPPPTLALLRSAARSLAAALPLAVVLFLFVPRLPGSFWALPRAEQALTGLGNEMSPGSISQLTESDEPAMRVRFDGALPPTAQRYWRGPVLHGFDGYTWRRRHPDPAPAPRLQFTGPAYGYEVTLEPNSHEVLIALELPHRPPPQMPLVSATYDYELTAPRPYRQRVSYRLESSPEHLSLDPLDAWARRMDLQLPADRNPRSLELGRSLRAQSDGDAAFIGRVLDFLRHGGFRYTLTPSLLNLDSVDDLLFNTREGFCGHYASAFVTLMRAGGVPAHVVTGYLGGVWNPYGGYLLIRQSDAHAWAEVWLDGRGWVHVDPTAVVAPERLTRELDDMLPAAGGSARGLRSPPWISSALQAWQAANAWWQDQFIGFNFVRQLGVIDRLGFHEHQLRALTLLLAGGGALWLAAIAWSLRPRSRGRPEDAFGPIWRAFERKLRRTAAPRLAHEGPVAFAERVGRTRPDLAAALVALARHYAQLRYGPHASQAQIDRLRRAVRLLRV